MSVSSTGSLEASEAASAAVAVAPRVALADIEAAIAYEYSFTAGRAIVAMQMRVTPQTPDPLDILTVCILVMKNGFTVIGKSAPASPSNFNAALGYKFAREDAIRQLWPLMGYALRDKLHNATP